MESEAKKPKIEYTPCVEEINNFSSLIDDCVFEIFNWLSLDDLCSISETCTKFKTLACQQFMRKYPEKVNIDL